MYKNILAEMARKGLTKRDVASILRLSESTFRKKMSGIQDFKTSEIKMLMSLFGNVTFEYLFGDLESKNGD